MASSTIEQSSQPSALPLPPALLILAPLAMIALLVLCVCLPLATYSLSLALFGLAHVLSELRYVHHRFGASIERRLRLVLGALLLGVVSMRLGRMFGLIPGELAGQLELALVFLLAVSVLPSLWRRGVASAAVGALVAGGLFVGLNLSVTHTLLLLAVLHNLTPLGFLADALQGLRRTWALGLAAVGFVVLPLFIASGLPYAMLAPTSLVAPDMSILPTGPLGQHLGAYLPAWMQKQAWAQHAFSAVVFAQCMHYAVVIHFLPRLLPESQREQPLKPWAWAAILILAGALLFVGFWFDFSQARAVYGVAAAVHAWVEVPILMLALLVWLPGRQ